MKMERLKSIGYYMTLMSEGCAQCTIFIIDGCERQECCSAYREQQQVKNLMEEAMLTFEDFIGLLEHWECQESQLYWDKIYVPDIEKELEEELLFIESSEHAIFWD